MPLPARAAKRDLPRAWSQAAREGARAMGANRNGGDRGDRRAPSEGRLAGSERPDWLDRWIAVFLPRGVQRLRAKVTQQCCDANCNVRSQRIAQNTVRPP